MSLLQFLLAMVIPVCVVVYTINFTIWLWRGGNRLGSVGAGFLAVISGLGALSYFFFKLLI